ncbi:porin family protein [Segetibacter aerophilus]|uniref:Outer membrane protein beta-barrel domain-containing protein n=1 Tax=Segetibacter aerophilus TaxID=670293 RepID=A0A512BC60_9BACT|nr:porin family protein [Segetibacter aerophilus]GEO09532.1 hypothetical protein SAE01_20280 [Segetibacter aerophilus]
MKIFATALIIMLCFIQGKAQESSKQVFKRFGFTLGSNYSNMIFSKAFPMPETSGNIKPKPGISFGFRLYVPIKDQLSIQTEYSFSTRNATAEKSERNYSLSYLSIPVLLKYKLSPRFFIAAGPEADLLISSKRTTKGIKEDLEHQTEARNVGVVLGVGYNIYKSLNVNASYLKGLINVGLESTEFKYEIAQLSLGIDF